MINKKFIGRKGSGGFYKLIKEGDKKVKYSLNLQTKYLNNSHNLFLLILNAL